MILKICPYCQTENPERANFCKKCGALFRGQPEIIDTVAEKNKKKNKLIFIICIILLIAALVVIASGSSDDTTVYPTTDSTTSYSATSPTTTVADTTTEATTTQAPSVNATTAPVSEMVTTQAPVQSVEEICKQFNEAVGALKAENADVLIHKTEKINLEITSFSLPVPTDTINSFMMKLIPETDATYRFSGGKAKEDSKVTISNLIPPTTKAAPEVNPDNLLSAEKDAQGNITLKFKADSSSFADGQTVFPLHVGAATDVLDFATFSLGPVKIVKADIQYPATEIKAEMNSDGKLSVLTIIQPVNVTSTGGVGSMTADVGMELKATTTYEISY